MKLTITEKNLFKRCFLFKGASDSFLEQIANFVQEKVLQKSDPIFLENEPSDFVYFILSGSVEIVKSLPSREQKRIRVLREGDHFSELSVLTSSKHSTSAFALEDTKLLLISGSDFMNLMNEHLDFSQSLARSLAEMVLLNLKNMKQVRVVEDTDFVFSPQMINLLPVQQIKKYKVLPVELTGKTFRMASSFPLDAEFLESFQKRYPQYRLKILGLKEDDFEKYQNWALNYYLSGIIPPEIKAQSSSPLDSSLTKEEFFQFSLSFSQLSSDVQKELALHVEERIYTKGEIVFNEEEELNSLVLVQSGEIELSHYIKDLSVYFTLDKALDFDVLGAEELLCHVPSTLMARANKKTKTLLLPKNIFEELMSTTDFVVPLCISLASRLQSFNKFRGKTIQSGEDDVVLGEESMSSSGTTKVATLNLPEEGGRDTKDPIRLLDKVLRLASQKNASDIHFEFFEKEFCVRFRVDGTMISFQKPLEREIGMTFVNRIKVLAQMDISERRRPQDGKFVFKDDSGEEVNARVSTLPARFGEKMVIRLLRKKGSVIPLNRLAPDKKVIQFLNRLTEYKQGLFLIAGPTGSGKTTTLYSVLNKMDHVEKNILTVEDPVELDLKGINQVQINREIGLDYSQVLRYVLRQDPDVILVGEIRDQESLQMVFEASLTGHLVLSTIHAANSVDVFPRLLELKARASQVATSLIGVMSQRLVRGICPHCKTARPLSSEELALFESAGLQVGTETFYGKGCEACLQTGYLGRLPLFEFWENDEQIQTVMMKEDMELLSQTIRSQPQFQPLLHYGLSMVARGFTTFDEIRPYGLLRQPLGVRQAA